jgi:hypothetical protein
LGKLHVSSFTKARSVLVKVVLPDGIETDEGDVSHYIDDGKRS